MQSTTSSSLIDPTDSNIPLTDVLDTEQRFSDAIKQKSFLDEKRALIYTRPAGWLIFNGYLPREHEWTLVNGKCKFDNWKPGDMYLYTRHLERNGMPSFPQEIDYCNIYGHDLEFDLEAWENTTEFINMKDNHRTKMVEMIYLEACSHYQMSNFPTVDKGPLSVLIRLQDMFIAVQRRVIAASTQLEEALTLLTKMIPKDADSIRNQESLMRKLITLEERSKCAPIGSRDTYWATRCELEAPMSTQMRQRAHIQPRNCWRYKLTERKDRK